MFERYTEGSRRALFFARDEAKQLGSGVIESQHLLLGLLKERGRHGSLVFDSDGLAFEAVRVEIAGHFPAPADTHTPHMPFGVETVQVFRHAAREADRLGHRHVAPVHLILGLLCESTSAAASVLLARGVSLAAVRAELAGRDDLS